MKAGFGGMNLGGGGQKKKQDNLFGEEFKM